MLGAPISKIEVSLATNKGFWLLLNNEAQKQKNHIS